MKLGSPTITQTDVVVDTVFFCILFCFLLAIGAVSEWKAGYRGWGIFFGIGSLFSFTVPFILGVGK